MKLCGTKEKSQVTMNGNRKVNFMVELKKSIKNYRIYEEANLQVFDKTTICVITNKNKNKKK